MYSDDDTNENEVNMEIDYYEDLSKAVVVYVPNPHSNDNISKALVLYNPFQAQNVISNTHLPFTPNQQQPRTFTPNQHLNRGNGQTPVSASQNPSRKRKLQEDDYLFDHKKKKY